jgi:hypothetical protein
VLSLDPESHIDPQNLAQLKETLEKMYKMMCNVNLNSEMYVNPRTMTLPRMLMQRSNGASHSDHAPMISQISQANSQMSQSRSHDTGRHIMYCLRIELLLLVLANLMMNLGK